MTTNIAFTTGSHTKKFMHRFTSRTMKENDILSGIYENLSTFKVLKR